MLASDEPPSAYLYVVQIPAPHLVIEQISGQSGQMSHLIDRVSQPPGSQVRSWLAWVAGGSEFIAMPGQHASQCYTSPARTGETWRDATALAHTG